MADELLLRRLRAVLWSVNGEPNANGNVDETACSEAADHIEQLTAERDRLRLYARHDDDCTINRYPATGACSCGLRVAHD